MQAVNDARLSDTGEVQVWYTDGWETVADSVDDMDPTLGDAVCADGPTVNEKLGVSAEPPVDPPKE